MVSQRMLQLGTARSVIRELFEYGRQRAAEVGAENVFDFSLGNPSVPAPAEVNETAIRLLREQADTIHCYTSAPGDPAARQRIADSLNRRFGEQYTADELYLTVGAAASLCCVLGGLTCPGDEYILFLKNIEAGDELSARIESFRKRVHDKVAERKQEVHCSIGFCQIKGGGRDLSECIAIADKLLYQAKEKGKDTYVIE